MNKQLKTKMQNKKWISLKARGINPPKDGAENQKRLKEAHSG